jgi:hypothetical protein
MQYVTYGKTGLKVSKLGFGAMRLPSSPTSDGKEQVDYDKSTPLIRKAIELGINFIDTHHNYHDSQSEIAIGLALEGLDRSKVFIQTKTPAYRDLAPGETHRSRLEAGLKRIKSDYFDIYFMHSLNWATFEKVGKAFMAEMERCKDEGLIRHLGFSTHASYEDIVKLVDTGHFESMLCQYNLLDLSNERAIEYAKSLGLGISVMGPVGGGRLSVPNELTKYVPTHAYSAPAAALRFVWGNRNVDSAVSGMSTIEQIEENVKTAAIAAPLSDEERRRIAEIREERKKLADLYCTGCEYCMPCPNGVEIPQVFEYMNWVNVYGLGDDNAREHYAWMKQRGKDASKCIECGQCEPKCPQKIPIIRQLKESHKKLG